MLELAIHTRHKEYLLKIELLWTETPRHIIWALTRRGLTQADIDNYLFGK